MSDLETVATVAEWLGDGYSVAGRRLYNVSLSPYALDPDQELGAIWRKAVADGREPAMRWDAELAAVYFSLLDRDGMPRYGVSPEPHLAARAAVCKLVGDAK